jgi:hypothetical protein
MNLSDNDKAWAFCEQADVKELLEQLNAGLIHPVEYADKILSLWKDQC